MSPAQTSRRAPVRTLAVDVVGASNLVGSLLKPLGLALVLPAAIAVGYREPVWPFLVSGLATSGFGVGLERVTHGKERVGAREGYLVVGRALAPGRHVREPSLPACRAPAGTPGRRGVRVHVGVLDDRRDRP